MANPRSLSALCVCLLATAAAPAGPQPTFTILCAEGQSIPGVGTPQAFHRVAVNDAGDWLVHLTADGAEVLVRNGQAVVRAGDPLPPPGAAAAFFAAAGLTGAGAAASIVGLANQPVGSNEGLYVGTDLVIQRGAASNAPQFSPGTTYTDLIELRTGSAAPLLMLASANDPGTPQADQGLVLITPGPPGSPAAEAVLARRGQVPAGQPLAIQNFGSAATTFALGGSGQCIFLAELAAASSANAVVRNNTVIAREGQASPVPGRNWASLHLGAYVVGMNGHGDFVFSGRLTGDPASDAVIVRNGAVFVQRGDTFPAIAPAVLGGGFTTAPLFITDGGEVVWFGDWGGLGLLVERNVLLEAGETAIGGSIVSSVNGGAHGFHASPGGRYIIARVTHGNDAADAVVLIDRGDGGGCAADWNEDGAVNSTDISAFLTSWLDSVQHGNLIADFDGDAAVNSTDISAFLTAWLSDVQGDC